MRGLFITFEGGEGSGKTTQIQQLKNWIESNMDSVNLCLTREPGGTIEAETIRALLLNGAASKWQPATEAMMMSASRHEHVTLSSSQRFRAAILSFVIALSIQRMSIKAMLVVSIMRFLTGLTNCHAKVWFLT